MRPWALEFAREAATDLESLYAADRSIFRRVLNKIERLAEHPQEGKRLAG